MATIMPDVGFTALAQMEVDEILKGNATRSENLRNSFFGGEA